MSMDDTLLRGVTRSPGEISQAMVKRLKSESKPKTKAPVDWKSKRSKDVVISDFYIYDDSTEPFTYICDRFEYKNNAQILREKEIEAAVADYRKRSENLTVFDAIAPPEIAGFMYAAVPLPLTDDRRSKLIPLCKLALEKYNEENQGTSFVFVDIEKTTYKTGGRYFMTFQAQEDPSNTNTNTNTNVTTFQAQVRSSMPGPLNVYSCAIKI